MLAKITKNLKTFLEFVSDNDSIIKPVVIDGDIYGFLVWKQGHTINFYNTDFENTAIANIGYKPGYINEYEEYSVSFEDFLKYAEEFTKDIEIELKHPEQLNE